MTVGRREGKSIRATAGEIGRGPSTVKREPAATPRAGGGAAPRPPGAGATPGGFAAQARAPGRPRPALARAGEGPPGAAVARAGGRQAGARARPAAVSGPATRRAIARRGPGAPEPRRTARGRRGACGTAAGAAAAARGGEGAGSPSPTRSAGGPPPPRRPTGGRSSRTGTGRRGRRGGVLLLRRPPPRERGAVENTSGLIREHLPKGTDFSLVTDGEVAEACDGTSRRPRERLGWRTPQEAHYSEALHLL